MKFNRSGNKITFPEKLHLSDIDEALASIHQATSVAGYRDVMLNFANTKIVAPEFMLAICDYMYELRTKDIDANLIFPADLKLSRLFSNTNWAYHIDPSNHAQSDFKGFKQVPATLFENTQQQSDAVSNIVNVLLSSSNGIERGDFVAFEWAINEITDNVLMHANSGRGLVQVSKFHHKQKKISFVVCDSGDGIPKTLRKGIPTIKSDMEALMQSIEEGVTRDKTKGQGNGLFGSYQICTASGGKFQIRSGNAFLEADNRDKITKNTKVPYNGTIIVSEIDFSIPNLLENALKFEGKTYTPWTRIEKRYEDEKEDKINFVMKNESTAFGNRLAGEFVRSKLQNPINMHNSYTCVIDLSGIDIISSSFADEVFGKIFLTLGMDAYQKIIKIINANEICEKIINKSLKQRNAL
ncbi:STAS-like domain-containing protein [Chromobacterium sphagni]|uniref:STAS-like domain-containing protein n=1 Tax=Chromobacterium sphagni TaxID=1903179 RepID=UPI0009F3BD09|nr:DUF4325 domain-containing protein [Chromobacterium sphagni]